MANHRKKVSTLRSLSKRQRIKVMAVIAARAICIDLFLILDTSPLRCGNCGPRGLVR